MVGDDRTRGLADRGRSVAGTLWSLTSAFLWATTFICARYMLAGGRVDPITLSMVRFVLGAGILLVVALATTRERLLAIRVREGLHLAGLPGRSYTFPARQDCAAMKRVVPRGGASCVSRFPKVVA